MELVENGIPRRSRIYLLTPVELEIRKARLMAEEAGCHTLLTEAVTLMGKAQELVADWVEL